MNEGQRDRFLGRSVTDLQWVEGITPAGTAAGARKVRRLTLALERMAACRSAHNPPGSDIGPRGGSTNAGGADERERDRRISHQARADRAAAERLIGEITRSADSLRALVEQYIVNDEIPTCASCARSEGEGVKRIGGHFAPVRGDVSGHQLCDWCYRHALADARDAGERLTRKHWPPVEACHRRHTISERAAGVWLAEWVKNRDKAEQRKSA